MMRSACARRRAHRKTGPGPGRGPAFGSLVRRLLVPIVSIEEPLWLCSLLLRACAQLSWHFRFLTFDSCFFSPSDIESDVERLQKSSSFQSFPSFQSFLVETRQIRTIDENRFPLDHWRFSSVRIAFSIVIGSKCATVTTTTATTATTTTNTRTRTKTTN